MNNYQKVIETLLYNNAYKATYYVSTKEIIRVVRKRYKFGKKKKSLPRKDHNIEMILTIGRPNYTEREFIKLCQKAKEPFPIKKIQIKV
jgi:hypothetical protein